MTNPTVSLPLADLVSALEFLPRRMPAKKFTLDGVLIEYTPGGPAILVAADGHVVGALRTDCAAQDRGAIMLPRDIIKRMRKAAGARRAKEFVQADVADGSATLSAIYGNVQAPAMPAPSRLMDWRTFFPQEYRAGPPSVQVDPALLARVKAAAGGEPVFTRENKHGAFVHTADMRALAIVTAMRDMEELPEVPDWAIRRWAPSPAGAASESAA